MATSQRSGGGRPTRCPICRQLVIGEMEWGAMSTIFGFDMDEVEGVDELSGEAYAFARRFQRGEITNRELWTRARAATPPDWGFRQS